ncbi:glucosamine-6-phosphate deaminase [Clostridia bacterium]|nr:glucosamine-6-phosphate deaminase [Clostridia bacterium]
MKIIQASSYQDMSRKAANLISAQVILHPASVLGLATGSTPVGIYKQLVEWYEKGDIDFSGVTTINLDEYCGLETASPQSYRYYMETHLFGLVNISAENTHLPDGSAEPTLECARYDKLITDNGGIDLQLLGLGHNGHIGFNEPSGAFEKMTHCVSLSEDTIEANQRFFKSKADVPGKAITMGLRSIMQAKKILLVVSGSEKAGMLERSLRGPISPEVPASILQLHPDLTVVTNVG